jgi:succinyl-CoA synthetase beta subunit
MSRLVEHQVKALLVRHGIGVPRGEICADPATAAAFAAGIAGPVYVKAQVAAGDRAALGAVRRCDDIDLVPAVAAEVLGLTVAGLPVETILVEEAVTGTWFGYAAVTVAEDPARQILRFSTNGGVGFDPSTAEFELDLVDAVYPHRIRRALRVIGLPSEQLVPVSSFLRALADVARRWGAYTLELNPVALTASGVVAVDAKADLDDYSSGFTPEPALVEEQRQDERERQARKYQAGDHRGSLRYVQLVPPAAERTSTCVASHSVGGGESMVVLDALAMAGLSPANYCDTSGSPSVEKVALASRLVASQPHISGLLFSTCIANQRLSVTATGLVRGWEDAGWRGPTVVRFAGNESDEARATVEQWAAARNAPIRVVGEDVDEWAAARLLGDLLDAVAESEETR